VHLPLSKHEQLVDMPEDAWTVCDNNHRRFTFLQVFQRFHERRLTIQIKIRVGLVQDDKPWIAVDRTG
jgi:hypothetical protein